MDYQIEFDAHPTRDDVMCLWDGLLAVAAERRDQPRNENYAFYVRDANSKIIAGCYGSLCYGCHTLEVLWVEESLRGRGIGASLVLAAEKFAKEKGCLFSLINTMEWEAPDYYQRFGYEVESVRAGYLHGAKSYCLRKDY